MSLYLLRAKPSVSQMVRLGCTLQSPCTDDSVESERRRIRQPGP